MEYGNIESRGGLGARCAAVLRAETDILRGIGAVQDEVGAAVRARKWAAYETLTRRIDEYGRALRRLEERRAALMAGRADAPDETRFYAFAAALPPEEGRALRALYREMRRMTRLIGIANAALAAYLESRIALAGRAMEAAFPDRRGALYGRRGTLKSADMRSVVINRSF